MDARRQAQRPLPDVCKLYNEGACLEVSCQQLHVCSWFILAQCSSNNGCTQVHDLGTPRNITLLRQMGWCGPDDMKLALNSLYHRLRGDHISICTGFNSTGCTKTSCFHLHVCYRHVLDSCPLDDCPLSHDVKGGQHNAEVLEAGGLTNTPVSDLLPRLRQNLQLSRIMQPTSTSQTCNIWPYRWPYDRAVGTEYGATGVAGDSGVEMDAEYKRQAQRPLPEMCQHYNRYECLNKNCQKLHVCFWFIIIRYRCTNGCTQVHDLETPRNMALLRQMGWCGPADMKLARDSLHRRLRGDHTFVCTDYNTTGCTKTSCFHLHVCYRHVLDSCPLDDCPLSHDMKGGQHNAEVLEAGGLTNTPFSVLLLQLRQNLQISLKLLPTICHRWPYDDCDRRCLLLHYCSAFVRGKCMCEEGKCLKSHSLQDPHNHRVLRFFGWTESQTLSALASRYGGATLVDENHPQRPVEVQRLIDYLEEKRQRTAQARDRERQQQGVRSAGDDVAEEGHKAAELVAG